MFMEKSPYTNITSPFIKKKLVKTSWSNHIYIDSLISLEKFIKNSPRSSSSSILFHMLKNKYKEEFLILCKEYSIERCNKELGNIKKKEREIISQGKRLKEREENLKNSWTRAGGLE